jgi:hypothetical protein
MAAKDAIAMNRFHVAAALQTSLHFLALKKWTPQQQPFAEALIKLLEIEKDELVKLGMTELVANHNLKEKIENADTSF